MASRLHNRQGIAFLKGDADTLNDTQLGKWVPDDINKTAAKLFNKLVGRCTE